MLVNSRLEKCQLSAQLSTDIEATGMAGNSMKYPDKNMKKTPDDTSLVFQSTSWEGAWGMFSGSKYLLTRWLEA